MVYAGFWYLKLYIYQSIVGWVSINPKRGENIVSTNMILTVDDLSLQATTERSFIFDGYSSPQRFVYHLVI